MADYHGVLVLAEMRDQAIAPITKELLGLGRKLAQDMGEGLCTLLLGSDLGATTKEVIALGADKVYVVDSAAFASYNSDSYLTAVTKVYQETKPAILLMGQTSIGRDLAPLVAARLGASLSTDCVDLKIDPATKKLVQTRPVYGGNALAVVVSKAYPQIATVRARAMEPAEPDASRQGEVVAVDVGSPETRVRIVDVVKAETGEVKLEEAKVVVAGGAGISEAKDFDLVKELAAVLGGAVGATRLPCEEGLVPWGYQIGQTGKIIAPDLYIAVAISGAPQHMAGCSGSKCIVAVNRDPQANIFKVADFGIMADYKQALPVMIKKCQEIKAGN